MRDPIEPAELARACDRATSVIECRPPPSRLQPRSSSKPACGHLWGRLVFESRNGRRACVNRAVRIRLTDFRWRPLALSLFRCDLPGSRGASLGARSLPQQVEETVDLVVDLRGVADDQRGGHGPRDDRADRARVAHPLSAIGAALAAFLNCPANRFAISLARRVPGLGCWRGRSGRGCDRASAIGPGRCRGGTGL